MASALHLHNRNLVRSGHLSFIDVVLNLFQTWGQYKKTVRELSELDNSQLKDIGISPEQIKSASFKSCFRRQK